MRRKGMTTTTYYGETAVDLLASAHVDAHAIASVGYCLTCRIRGPYQPRMSAESVFAHSLWLPCG